MKQLQADLESAIEEKQNLEDEHLYTLQVDALDNLVTKAEEAIDTSIMTFKETVDFFAEVVDEYSRASENTNTQWVTDSTIQFFSDRVSDGVSEGISTGITELYKQGVIQTAQEKNENISETSSSQNESASNNSDSTYTTLSKEEFINSIRGCVIDPALLQEQLAYNNVKLTGIYQSEDYNVMQLSKIMWGVEDIAKRLNSMNIVADIDLNYENLVRIDGNTDAVTYKEMKKELKGVSKEIISSIYDSLSKAGISRKY